MSYDYVKRTYGVNPVVGERVRHHLASYGLGTIQRENPSQRHYVMVKFDNGKAGPCHPTEMDYLGSAHVVDGEMAIVDDLLEKARIDLADRLSWGGPTISREAAEARTQALEDVRNALRDASLQRAGQ